MLFSIALRVASAAAALGSTNTSTADHIGSRDMSPALVLQQAPQIAKARTADREYLRALADALEAERMSVHAMMSDPVGHAAHGGTMDPADWDNALDALQREALSMLKHDYGETLSPSAARRTATSAPRGKPDAASSTAPQGDGGQSAMRGLATMMHETIALSNRYAPTLRRASTRDLCRRVKKSQTALRKQLAGTTE